MKVVEPKLSAASSDEEKLVAGILNDWTANQETLWSAAEKTYSRKKDEGGNLES